MGRFNWLEADKSKKDTGEGRSGQHGDSEPGPVDAASTKRNIEPDGEISRFGRTSTFDGVVFDSMHFKREGFAAYEACDFERALLNFSKCLSENNNDEEAWVYQIISQIHIGKQDDSLTWAKRAYGFFGDSADIQSLLGLCLALNGNCAEGMTHSDAALAKKKPGFFVWMARGEIILNSGTMNNAFVCFKNASAFRVTSGSKNLDFEIAMALSRAKKYSLALSHFKKAIQAGLCNPFIYVKVGEINEKLEFFEESEFYYRLATDLDNSFRPANEGFARVREHNTFFAKLFRAIANMFNSKKTRKNDPET